jgi:two-component system, OmpR family, sensor histidine kinase ResE
VAAHELRTPLTSIKGYLYIFLRNYRASLDSEQMTFLTRMSIATQRLGALVENLLNVTRIEKGVMTIHLESIDWIENTKLLLAELIDQATDKKIEIKFQEPSEHYPNVGVDKFRINEVLSNLISNAINYTNIEGQVKIWFEKTPDEVITHVQDNGPGIPADALPHLFTKFFRVSGNLEQGSKGTGLGLYITKSIIEMHKGKIWVDSEVDKGSIFSFSLPIYKEDKH